ncbi:hypothetical protein [Winogradskyella sp.]|nr:hypothetical protein [Winogradskyella sp.]
MITHLLKDALSAKQRRLKFAFGECVIIGFGYGFVTEWYASIIPQ